jgi:ribosomal protein S18 acetylase RimI-like enzyme
MVNPVPFSNQTNQNLIQMTLSSNQRKLRGTESGTSIQLRQGDTPLWPLDNKRGGDFLAVKSQKYGVTVWLPYKFSKSSESSTFFLQANGREFMLSNPNNTFNGTLQADRMGKLIDDGKFNIAGLYLATGVEPGLGKTTLAVKQSAELDWLSYSKALPNTALNRFNITLVEGVLSGTDPGAAVYSGSGSIVARIGALGPAYMIGLIDGLNEGAGGVLSALSLGASGRRNGTLLSGAREAAFVEAQRLGVDVSLIPASEIERARAERMPLSATENPVTRALYERGKLDAKAAALELLGGGVELRGALVGRAAARPGAYAGVKQVEFGGMKYFVPVDGEGRLVPLEQLRNNPGEMQRYKADVGKQVGDLDRAGLATKIDRVALAKLEREWLNGSGDGGIRRSSGGSPRRPGPNSGGTPGSTYKVSIGGQVFTVLREEVAPAATTNQGPLVRAMQNGADKNAQATALAWADGAWYVDNLMRKAPGAYKALTQLGEGETIKLVRPMGNYKLDVYVTGTEVGAGSGGTLAITVVTPWGGKVSMRPAVGAAGNPLEISDTVKAALAVRNPSSSVAVNEDETNKQIAERLAARDTTELNALNNLADATERLAAAYEKQNQDRTRALERNMERWDSENLAVKLKQQQDRAALAIGTQDLARQNAELKQATEDWTFNDKNIYKPYLAQIERVKGFSKDITDATRAYVGAANQIVRLQKKFMADSLSAEATGVPSPAALRAQLEKIKSKMQTAQGIRNRVIDLSRSLGTTADQLRRIVAIPVRGADPALTSLHPGVLRQAEDARDWGNAAGTQLAGGRTWLKDAQAQVRALEDRVLRTFGLNSAAVQKTLAGPVFAELKKSVDAMVKAKGTNLAEELLRLSKSPDEAAVVLGDVVAKVRGAANGLNPTQIETLKEGLQKDMAGMPAALPSGQSPRLIWVSHLVGRDTEDYKVWQRLLERHGPNVVVGNQNWENIPDNGKAWEHIKRNNPDLADTIERAVRENPGIERDDILALMRRGATVLEAIAALKSGGAAVGGVPPGNNNPRVGTATSPDDANLNPQQTYEALGRPKTLKVTIAGLEFDVETIQQLGLTAKYQYLKGSLDAAQTNRLLNAFAGGGAEAVFKIAPNLPLDRLADLVTLTFGLKGRSEYHDLQHLFGKVTASNGGSYNVTLSGEAEGRTTILRDLLGGTSGESRSFYEDIQVTRDDSGRLQVQISEATKKAIEDRFEKIYQTRETSFNNNFRQVSLVLLLRTIEEARTAKRSPLDFKNSNRTDTFIKGLTERGFLPLNPDPQLIADLRNDFAKFDSAYTRLTRSNTHFDELISSVNKRLSQAATQDFMKTPKAVLREQFLRGIGLSTGLRVLRDFPTPANTKFNDTWLRSVNKTGNTGEFGDVIDITTQLLNRMNGRAAEGGGGGALKNVTVTAIAPLPAGFSIRDSIDAQGVGSMRLLDGSGKQVGTVFTVRHASDPKAARISGILIDQSQRSQGLGSALMLQVEQLYRARGFERLELSTVPGSERFYERLGFKPLTQGSSTWSKPLIGR